MLQKLKNTVYSLYNAMFEPYKNGPCYKWIVLFCLFDLILYVPSTIFQLNRDGSSWVEQVLS